MAEQLGAHALRVGALLVDLVDGDDHRHLRRLGVIDGLHRLRLDAVIGGHHQHDDIRHLGASLAHGGKRLVAWRVDKGDLLAGRRHHLIGADMLGDAAGFLAHHVGRADGVEQRGLAVIDVAHDGHHRRTGLHVLGDILGADEAFFDVGLRHPAHDMAELLGDELSGIGIDHIGDLVHLAVFHQVLDDVDAALGHAVGELLDGDDFRDHHVALNLLLRLRTDGLLLLPLAMALQRGKAPLALLFVERVGDGQAAADPALFAGTRLDGALFLVARLLRAGSFLFLFLDDEMLAGDFLAFAPGLGFGLVPRLLLLLALDRLVVLLGLDLLGDDAAAPPLPWPSRARSPRAGAIQSGPSAVASFSSSERARSTTPGRRCSSSRARLAGVGSGAVATFGFGSSTGCAAGVAPTARRFFFSTRTDLERPWLKL